MIATLRRVPLPYDSDHATIASPIIRPPEVCDPRATLTPIQVKLLPPPTMTRFRPSEVAAAGKDLARGARTESVFDGGASQHLFCLYLFT
ncbi:hypothetical protein LSTR_LSTR012910 [Laodelphax striatellus]|uniref:Uncharacterized protein n=1 Tax=Laodelphax striatellus TaxID=195883 RepID=A0A482X7F8_LAOST|nr:hypothetical protein LSTR_LSTR012910 [Laodelphax striatellus]